MCEQKGEIMNRFFIILLFLLPLTLNAQYENENSIIINDIEYYMAIDQFTYVIGDSVHMNYRISNRSSSPITFYFNTAQQYDFFVTQNSVSIWHWSFGFVFAQVIWFMTVNPGNSTEVFYSWNMTDYFGDPISPGNYEVTGIYACSNNVPVSVNFEYLPVDAEDETIVFSELNLSNHPNPFNPQTTISFSLKDRAKVKLSIYNIIGQKIKTLLDTYSSKGIFEIIWRGTDDKKKKVASGNYFIKLKVNGEEKAVRKCILLK
jgi:hypothetical protein